MVWFLLESNVRGKTLVLIVAYVVGLERFLIAKS